MYKPYPDAEPARRPARARPPAVRNAIWLMYLGAALEVPAIIADVADRSAIRQSILRHHPGDTAAQLGRAENGQIVLLVILGLIGLALWLWMAWANGRGLAWARIVAAVLYGISTVGLPFSLVLSGNAPLLAIDVVGWLAGTGAIVLLFSRQSRPFFRPAPAA